LPAIALIFDLSVTQAFSPVFSASFPRLRFDVSHGTFCRIRQNLTGEPDSFRVIIGQLHFYRRCGVFLRPRKGAAARAFDTKVTNDANPSG
jgi:hypothetical protein